MNLKYRIDDCIAVDIEPLLDYSQKFLHFFQCDSFLLSKPPYISLTWFKFNFELHVHKIIVCTFLKKFYFGVFLFYIVRIPLFIIFIIEEYSPV